jgi:hypothetical protein
LRGIGPANRARVHVRTATIAPERSIREVARNRDPGGRGARARQASGRAGNSRWTTHSRTDRVSSLWILKTLAPTGPLVTLGLLWWPARSASHSRSAARAGRLSGTMRRRSPLPWRPRARRCAGVRRRSSTSRSANSPIRTPVSIASWRIARSRLELSRSLRTAARAAARGRAPSPPSGQAPRAGWPERATRESNSDVAAANARLPSSEPAVGPPAGGASPPPGSAIVISRLARNASSASPATRCSMSSSTHRRYAERVRGANARARRHRHVLQRELPQRFRNSSIIAALITNPSTAALRLPPASASAARASGLADCRTLPAPSAKRTTTHLDCARSCGPPSGA